jgi:hypothetical protein
MITGVQVDRGAAVPAFIFHHLWDATISHFFGSRIEVAGDRQNCPHILVHSFVHEVGHVQMLFLDVVVFSAGLSALKGSSWGAYALALVAWQFVWRELTADLYAVTRLGLRNTVLGYSHYWRKRRSRGQGH